MEEPGRHAEIDDQEDRSRDDRQEGDVVARARDVAVPPRVEEVGDRGDHERPAGQPPQEEVQIDQERPVRALEETLPHQAPPLSSRLRNATSAPSPTSSAEPIESSESAMTVRFRS